MAMNRARRTSNLNNILTYDTLGNSTLIANLTVEGLTGAGFVKADAAGLLSVDTAAYTVTTGATNYLTKITGANTLGQSLVYDNGNSVLVNSTVGVPGYGHAFQVVANAAGGLVVSTTDVASAIGIVNSSSANKTWDISPYGNHLVINESGIATRMKFDAGGNITIGDIVNTGHKLEIVGSFRTTGTNTLSQLQGVGDRMVVANTNGVLSTQAIPTGSITGSGAAGQVNFWTGTNTVSGSNNLFWDNANGRLGIGTATPNAEVQITKASAAAGAVGQKVYNTTSSGETYNAIYNDLSEYGSLGIFGSTWANTTQRRTASFATSTLNGFNIALFNSSATANFSILTGTTLTERLRLYNNSGNLVLQNGGTFTDLGQRLQVMGDTFVRGTGNTNTTNALAVQNSDSVNIFRVRNDGLTTMIDAKVFKSASPTIQFQDQTGLNNGYNNAEFGIWASDSRTFLINSWGKVGLAITSHNFSNTGNSTVTINSTGLNGFLSTNGGHSLVVPLASSVQRAITIVRPDNTLNTNTTDAIRLSSSTYGTYTFFRVDDIGNLYTRGSIVLGNESTAVGTWASIAAGTTTRSQINLAAGVDPATPTDGDMWATSTDIKARVGGTTYSLINSGLSGSGTAGQVTYWNSASGLTGSANLFWNNPNNRLELNGVDSGDSIRIINRGFITFSDTTNTLTNRFRGIASGFVFQDAAFNTRAQISTGAGLTYFNAAGGGVMIGTSSDLGVRLGVVGDTLLRGSGNTDVTTALTVQNSSSTNLFTVRNDGALLVGTGVFNGAPLQVIGDITASGGIYSNTYGYNYSLGNTKVFTQLGNTTGTLLTIRSTISYTGTGNQTSCLIENSTFAPTSGSGIYNGLTISPTINQTGGANGITRGLYVNPTLTAAADFRAIEWSNNVATAPSVSWGLYGAGTAPNYLGGALSIGVIGGSQGLRIGRAPTNADSASNLVNVAIPTTSTTRYRAFASSIGLNTSGFTLPDLSHFEAIQDGAFTAGVVTNQYGFRANTLLDGTNVYAFHSNIPAATGRWNLYMVGTAINYLNGALLIGSATNDTVNKLQVTGTIVAGSATSTNGSVILRGSYTNGYLTTIGTDASSGGPMVSYGVESAQNSTAGAFVSSSGIAIPRSAYVQTGGHIWYTAASSTTAIGTAVTMTKHMELYNSGNLVLGGGADDAVNKLQVSGGVSIAGRAIISSTTEHQLEVANPSGGRLLVFVSATANSFSFRDSQGYGIHHSTGYSGFNARQSNIRLWTQAADTTILSIGGQDVNPTVARTRTIIEPVSSTTTAFSPTSGTAVDYLFRTQSLFSFQPTSGTATYTQIQLSPTINQTGGANGVTRGLYINPTLTASADWRSIEWSNNTGWGLYGVGTAKNYLNGTTLIGTLTDDGVNKLQVAGSIKSTGIMRSDASRTAAINDVSIALLGSNITTYTAGFTMAGLGYGLNAVYAQHEQRFGGNASFDEANLNGGGLVINKLAPTAAGTITMGQAAGRIRTMSNLHLMTQFDGNNNLTITHMSGLHIYGHYRTSGTGVLTVSTAYYGIFLADPNEFSTGATVTGGNYGFYQQGAAPYNYFGGKVSIGTTATDGTSKLRISGLPTSNAGLLTGEVWNNGGVLTIV